MALPLPNAVHSPSINPTLTGPEGKRQTVVRPSAKQMRAEWQCAQQQFRLGPFHAFVHKPGEVFTLNASFSIGRRMAAALLTKGNHLRRETFRKHGLTACLLGAGTVRVDGDERVAALLLAISNGLPMPLLLVAIPSGWHSCCHGLLALFCLLTL